MNLSPEDMAEVPPAVVTVTLTMPAVPAGAVATIRVPMSLTRVAANVPNFTTTGPTAPRLMPVMVTEAPPARGPDLGVIPVTVGAAT